MKNLEKILTEFSREITNHYTEENIYELSAEIAKGKQGLGYVPRKIFDEQNKQIAWENLGPEWKAVLQEIIVTLNKNPKLAVKFAPDAGDVDVHLGKGKNFVFLTADDGTKLKYNVASKKLEAA